MAGTHFPAFASRRLPNVFDVAALLVIAGMLFALAHGAKATLVPLSALEAEPIHLEPNYLPGYALRTTLRMFAALACSLLFTFTYAVAAAKSRRAELVMVPILDVLQSVPILGFLSFTVVFFMNLFPGQVLGAELAAVFAIFTSQAWNMAFSMFQSLKTVPADLNEAAVSFRLSGWQKFWRLEVPFAMPGLVWNTMMSMSGGWFFVVASEAVTVGDTSWKLPGIGSYVAAALEARDIGAVLWAIVAMAVVILIYDQVLFRPLTTWSAKFRVELTPGEEAEDPWLLRLLRRTHWLRVSTDALGEVLERVGGLRLALLPRRQVARAAQPSRVVDAVFLALVAVAAAAALWKIVDFVAESLTWADLGTAALLGLYTLVRVAVMMAIATAIWVPVGVWLGLRPKWSRRVQPVVQFMAAFPANLFFPPFVLVIVYFNLMPDIWLTPLMVLGTQWYILFNVIAGASAFPGDLQEASKSFHINGWLWWRRVILPGIFPYYVTGAITASGGSWNAAIVSEVAAWGDTKLAAHGLGAYIAQATDAGDTAKIVLGVVVMAVYVICFNRLLWRPLYAYGTRRLTIS